MTVSPTPPAGSATLRTASALRPCSAPIRRLRHDCNDGYGGSGSGLFDEAGRLIAMQSASSVMNAKHAFDPEFHYGSALVFEGDLLAKLRRDRREIAGQDGRPRRDE